MDIINIGIILAAGNSTRFISNHHIPKQLFMINQKPVIIHSIDAFIKTNKINLIIIITNSKYFDSINYYQNQYIKNTETEIKIEILINDIDCRIESINTGLDYINSIYSNDIPKNIPKNIIIHDSARPFITSKHIIDLLDLHNDNYLYTQYYMKLYNGLLNIKTLETVNRDDYLEICTPICINYDLLKYFHEYYLNKKDENGNRIYFEYIPLLKNIKYKLVEGHYKYLKKITTIDDI